MTNHENQPKSTFGGLTDENRRKPTFDGFLDLADLEGWGVDLADLEGWADGLDFDFDFDFDFDKWADDLDRKSAKSAKGV